LDRELKTIAKYGFAPLFLIVADIVRFAHEAEVPVGTRGSVANSLVAYCIGITTVDPIEHGLIFERFLNPSRKDLPDIDLDFCSRRRDKVLDYVRRTYGEEKVALVATVNTLRPRSAIRETAKAYGLGEDEIGRLAGMVPRGRRQAPTLEEVLAKINDPRLEQVVRRAFSIVGQPHHLSLHPGGVVITPGPLTDLIPLQWSLKGFSISQYDYRDVEAIGLPKLDLLGIRALTVLADTIDLVRAHYDSDFQLENIPFDDAAAGDLLSRGESIGVFQCESSGAIRTLRRIKSRTITDLAVGNAFFRPGPMMGGMAKSFIRRIRGEEPVSYLHPSLEPILGATRGVIIFQEQILWITREIAGFSWDQADRLRRGISKQGAEDLSSLEDEFLRGCQRPPPEGHGLSADQAEKLWEQAVAFSGFGFNQGHATAYAQLSYRSAYMKAHWPAAFLTARLADRGGYHHPAVYIAEAIRLGFRVRPPHVNQSKAKFTLSWDSSGGEELWMGLDQVRDLRQSTIESIIDERARKPFDSLRDLMARVQFQGKEISHLCQCGGLDGLGPNRAALLAEAMRIKSAGSERQMALSFDEPRETAETPEQALVWEKSILGQPVSVHPLDLVTSIPDHTPLRELGEKAGGSISVVGVRLPGWTGGGGFFLGDRETYVMLQLDDFIRTPALWSPIIVEGNWNGDGMDSFWVQARRISPIVSN
jgi:DNA-directed DNA polymerase III PolC